MKKEEFKLLIESIGFEKDKIFYRYKVFRIYSFNNFYSFDNGSEWIWDLNYNDLTPLNKYLKKEMRSIKLKELLR